MSIPLDGAQGTAERAIIDRLTNGRETHDESLSRVATTSTDAAIETLVQARHIACQGHRFRPCY